MNFTFENNGIKNYSCKEYINKSSHTTDLCSNLIQYPQKILNNIKHVCTLKINKIQKVYTLSNYNGLLNYDFDTDDANSNIGVSKHRLSVIKLMHKKCGMVCNCNVTVEIINKLNYIELRNRIGNVVDKLHSIGFTKQLSINTNILINE